MESSMSYLHIAAVGDIALVIGYVLVVLIVIAVVGFAVVKLFGRSPRYGWHRRGSVGASEEDFDPDDGTPHTFDS